MFECLKSTNLIKNLQMLNKLNQTYIKTRISTMEEEKTRERGESLGGHAV